MAIATTLRPEELRKLERELAFYAGAVWRILASGDHTWLEKAEGLYIGARQKILEGGVSEQEVSYPEYLPRNPDELKRLILGD